MNFPKILQDVYISRAPLTDTNQSWSLQLRISRKLFDARENIFEESTKCWIALTLCEHVRLNNNYKCVDGAQFPPIYLFIPKTKFTMIWQRWTLDVLFETTWRCELEYSANTTTFSLAPPSPCPDMEETSNQRLVGRYLYNREATRQNISNMFLRCCQRNCFRDRQHNRLARRRCRCSSNRSHIRRAPKCSHRQRYPHHCVGCMCNEHLRWFLWWKCCSYTCLASVKRITAYLMPITSPTSFSFLC